MVALNVYFYIIDMSSWLKAPVKPIRLGYRQIIPHGNFIVKEKPATVVSAYYEMSSKYTKESYRVWIRLFLENIPCYLIFFIEEHLEPFIKECRKNYLDKTTIVILPREKWVANTKFSQEVWNKLHSEDPEKNIHTPELYKIWFEKNEFVRRAIELNPYNHTDFVWTDAGCCRSEGIVNIVKNYPVASRIPTDKIIILNIMPFTVNDEKPEYKNGIEFIGGIAQKPRLGANIIAGSIDKWKEYTSLYYKTLDKYIKANIFWGKDQDIMKTLFLENRSILSLIEIKPIAPESWHYSLIYLGCSDKLFNILRDEKLNNRKKSYLDLLRLS
jgi:hypothetical protein